MRTFLSACLGLVLVAAASAQQAPAVSDAGVARLSLAQGEVSTQRGADGEWTAAAINAPLLGGDSVATAEGGCGELQLDFADVLRLDSNSQATLANLSRTQIQVQVGQGVVDYVLSPGGDANVEIDTPNLAVHPLGAGVVRIQVNSDAESIVTVRSGSADISTSEGSARLENGQTITVEGTDAPQYQIADAPPLDGFDLWNQERDRSAEEAASWSHANRYYTGVGDLDGYGRWVFVPGYGQVWSPYVNAGWVPYSAGRWVWEPGWGWTWVSSEAWGWAPYHYGRWFYYQTGWVWWPGPVMVTPRYRPVWAPAYVAFVGLRVGAVRVGVGFGSVGWVPIGPADPYRPWWNRVGREARPMAPLAPMLGVRVVVYSNLNRMDSDEHVRRAVVSVPADRFGRGVVVRQTVSAAQMRQARVMGGALPMAPSRESMRVSDRPVNVRALPRAATAPRARYYRAPAPGVARPAAAPQGARPETARPAAPAPQTARPAINPRPGYRRFGGGSPTPAARVPQPSRPAKRSAGLGPRGPQAGVSMPPRAVTAGRLTSGTRGAAAHGPAPTHGPRPVVPAAPRAQGEAAPRTAPNHAGDPTWHRFSPPPAKAGAGQRGGKKPADSKTPPKKKDGRGPGGGGFGR